MPKKLGLFLIRLLILPFVLTLLFLPLLGLAFLAGMAGAVVADLMGVAGALGWLALGAKVYAALAVFSFCFHLTFNFQNCCVGMGGLGRHIAHQAGARWAETIFFTLTWPVSWFLMDRFLRGWTTSFPEAVFNALSYWTVGWWHGTTVTTFDFASGEMTEELVRTPEEAQDALREAVHQAVQKSDKS